MDKRNIFTKEFYEYYAKICLEYTYDKKYQELVKGESPDWHSYALDVGVEITQGISKSKGHSRAVMSSYFGKGFPDKYIPQEIYEPNSFNNIFDSSLDDYVDISGRQITKAYLSKTMKLNSHYSIFSSNQLFIYAFKSLTEDDLYKCFQIDLSNFHINFNICYINCIDTMYVCDFAKRAILDVVRIELTDLMLLKTQSLKYSTFLEEQSN